MANINLRNVPDDIYNRLRLTAAMGGTRIPKGALERLCIRAFKRILEDPEPGAGMPKLKLCGKCFQANAAAMNAPKATVVPPSVYDVAPTVVIPADKKPPVELFSHLLGEIPENSTASGMLAVATTLEVDREVMSILPPSRVCVTIPSLQIETAPIAGDAVEVAPGLWVGQDSDFNELMLGSHPEILAGWSVVSAAKEPWHRGMVGYKTRSAPEGAERLWARRGNHLALNLIDVRELGPGGECYVPDSVVETALAFIDERLDAGDRVLVHAGTGKSRAPLLAYLYLLRKGALPSLAAEPAFRERYPRWLPSAGIEKYLSMATAQGNQ